MVISFHTFLDIFSWSLSLNASKKGNVGVRLTQIQDIESVFFENQV